MDTGMFTQAMENMCSAIWQHDHNDKDAAHVLLKQSVSELLLDRKCVHGSLLSDWLTKRETEMDTVGRHLLTLFIVKPIGAQTFVDIHWLGEEPESMHTTRGWYALVQSLLSVAPEHIRMMNAASEYVRVTFKALEDVVARMMNAAIELPWLLRQILRDLVVYDTYKKDALHLALNYINSDHSFEKEMHATMHQNNTETNSQYRYHTINQHSLLFHFNLTFFIY